MISVATSPSSGDPGGGRLTSATTEKMTAMMKRPPPRVVLQGAGGQAQGAARVMAGRAGGLCRAKAPRNARLGPKLQLTAAAVLGPVSHSLPVLEAGSCAQSVAASSVAMHCQTCTACAPDTFPRHLMASSWSTLPPTATAAIWVNRSGAPEAKAKRVTPATSGVMRISWARYCDRRREAGRRRRAGALDSRARGRTL